MKFSSEQSTRSSQYFCCLWILLTSVMTCTGMPTPCSLDVFITKDNLEFYFNTSKDSDVYIIEDCTRVQSDGLSDTGVPLPAFPVSTENITISWSSNDSETNYSISINEQTSVLKSLSLSIPNEGRLLDHMSGFVLTLLCLPEAMMISMISLQLNITNSLGSKQYNFILEKDCRESLSSDISPLTPLELEDFGSGMEDYNTLFPFSSLSFPTSLEETTILLLPSTTIYIPSSLPISSIALTQSSIEMSSIIDELTPSLSMAISSRIQSSSPMILMEFSSPVLETSTQSLTMGFSSPLLETSTANLTPSLTMVFLSQQVTSTIMESSSPSPELTSTIIATTTVTSTVITSSSKSSFTSMESSSHSQETSTISVTSTTSSSAFSQSISSVSSIPTATVTNITNDEGNSIPWLLYPAVFGPVVGFLIVCIIIILCCLCCIKCARKPKSSQPFADYEAEPPIDEYLLEFEDEDLKKKEDIPIKIWMTLPWGHITSLPIYIQKMVKILNIDRRKLTITSTFLRGKNGCLSNGLLLMDSINPASDMNSAAMFKLMTGLGEGGRREDITRFIDQASLMQGLEHPNILQVMGISLEDNCVPIVIYPISEYGNLHSFLELYRVSPESSPLNPFTVEFEINFAQQVCSGMKFLSEKGIIHHDLALRNCWLDTNYQIKISDGALSQEFYPDCYSTIKGALRPVKWSALETLQEGLTTTQSNVWSYGIVMWEIFSLADTPYPEVPNGSVISHLMLDERLPQPHDCPDEIYQLMYDCWKRRGEQRPHFASLYISLKHISKRYPPVTFPTPVTSTYSSQSLEPTYSTFMNDTLQPISVTLERNSTSDSRYSGSSVLYDPVVKRKKISSGHLSSSSLRGVDKVSLSFSVLSSGDTLDSSSNESDNEGGGSFPSTLKSQRSVTGTNLAMQYDSQLVSQISSIATLQPISPQPTVPVTISPDVVSKTSTMDDSVSARSSMVLQTTAQSVSGTDRSSFISTGIDSISTTLSTPLPNSVLSNHTPNTGMELRTYASSTDETHPRIHLTEHSTESNSLSPQVTTTTFKSTDSGIRSDDENLMNGVVETPSLRVKTDERLETESSHTSRTSFGLGLSDLQSDLMAALDSFNM